MNIREFSELHRVRTKRDTCGETIIPGKRGHIYEHGSGQFGVLLMFETAKKWGNSKRRMEAAGLEVTLDCDTEGMVLFYPTDKKMAQVAIREAGIKRIRVMSEKQRQAAKRGLEMACRIQEPRPQEHAGGLELIFSGVPVG